MDFLQVIGTIKAWIEWWKSINQLPLISRKHITIPQWWMYILPITYLFSPWRPNHGVFVCGRKHENVEKKKESYQQAVDNFVDKLFLKTIHSCLLKDLDSKVWLNFFELQKLSLLFQSAWCLDVFCRLLSRIF